MIAKLGPFNVVMVDPHTCMIKNGGTPIAVAPFDALAEFTRDLNAWFACTTEVALTAVDEPVDPSPA